MTPETKIQIAALKEVLSRTRYRVAMLHFGRKLTIQEVAWRLRLSRRMVLKHVVEINKLCGELRHVAHRHRVQPSGDLAYVAAN